VSLGLLQAYAAAGAQFGILHVDAHADLRVQYEGFKYSHASIMHNALAVPQVERIVQVGIRDFCAAEAALMRGHERIAAFTDGYINAARSRGITWDAVCEEIVGRLPDRVYISFDIDGLDPSLCPTTGTPVPGGLSFGEAAYLLGKLCERGKKIIGFDLVETAVRDGSDWDAVVGARLLYQLCCRAIVSMQ
jgi:agmatinase